MSEPRRRKRPRRKPESEVGYGRPPVNEQFGNPNRTGRVNTKGRPKKPRAPPTLSDALDEKVHVKEDGRQKTYTRRQVIYKQIVRRASEGDLRAAKMVFEYDARLKEEGPEVDPFGIDPRFVEEMLKKHDQQTEERARRRRRSTGGQGGAVD